MSTAASLPRVRVFDGSIKKGDTLRMMQAEGDFLVDGVGVKRPAETRLTH